MSESTPNTEPTTGQPDTPLRANPLTLLSILKETIRLYKRAGLNFTRVLLPPVGLMALTFYGFTLLLTLINNQIIHHPRLVQAHPLEFILLSLLLALVAIVLVLKGGWQYLVYWASLNRNAQEAIENRSPDFRGAYHHIAKEQGWPYKTLVAMYCALPLLACLPVLLAPILGGFAGAEHQWAAPVFMLGGIVFSGLLLLLWLLAAVFFTFIFQITAFEGLSASPARAFLQSARLTLQRFGTTLALQVILLISTNYLLNYPMALLLRVLRLSQPLDQLHQWILMSYLDGLEPTTPLQEQAMSLLQGHLPDLAAGLTDSLLMVLITALLLPLGTFAFTLLYRDIQQQARP